MYLLGSYAFTIFSISDENDPADCLRAASVLHSRLCRIKSRFLPPKWSVTGYKGVPWDGLRFDRPNLFAYAGDMARKLTAKALHVKAKIFSHTKSLSIDRLSLALVILLVFACPLVRSQSIPQPRTRTEFVAAMAKIKEGMTAKEVLDILGKPDDIRTQFDPGGISRVHTKEIWCYGANAHLSFPTLGCVYMDEDGQAQEAFGGEGQPPPSNMFTEDQLRDLLRLLDTTPALEGYSYNPLPVIRIVNTLQPLGKEKALAAIGEYIRVSGGWDFENPHEGMFLVLRVLFDVPDNIDPDQAGGFGAPWPCGPKDPHRIPRFPIALVDDIPLMLVSGYELEGMPTPMSDVLMFFRVNGQLRPKPLVPSNDPLSAIVHLMNSRQWIYADTNLQAPYGISFGSVEDSEREKSMLMEQLLRLIDSVYRLPTDASGNRLPCGEPPEPAWQKVVSGVSALKIRWDRQQNMFVFRNGMALPQPEKKIYRRQIWKFTSPGLEDAELVLERKSDSWVDATLSCSEKSGDALRPATLLLFDNKEAAAPLETYTFTNIMGADCGLVTGWYLGLKPGSEVTAKLFIPGYSTNSSPVLTP